MALLDPTAASTYADWFATLADATRVRLLHAVASTPSGSIRVGDLAVELGISQATCSHHVRRLAEVGFVAVDKVGTASLVSINPACCTGLPHAADVVMGTLGPALAPGGLDDLPADVTTRAMLDADLPVVREIYAEGIATRLATFETEAPDVATLADKWLPGHRWV
ncbi:helix-turn-helix domain-containing GNAT family N-acetyltransferase, partial [Nocardioides sp.]|uniref:helix-turn-helix domain-containing GNAT family N-acetyltransferase n=1 Tax=Nocardioides sp. TaxID=35761 RepID=UPI002B278608